MDPTPSLRESRVDPENTLYTSKKRKTKVLPISILTRERDSQPSEESSSKEKRIGISSYTSPKEGKCSSSPPLKERRLSQCYKDIKTTLSGSGGLESPSAEQIRVNSPCRHTLAAMKSSGFEDIEQFDPLENEVAVIAHDRELTAYIKKISIKHLMDASVIELNNNVYQFCSAEVFAYVAANKLTCGQFKNKSKEFLDVIYSNMCHPAIVLKSSWQYFKALRQELFGYMTKSRSRTATSSMLYDLLCCILKTTNVTQITPLLETAVSMHLHDEMPTVLNSLCKWNSNTKQKALQEKLLKHMAQISPLAEKAALLSSHKHYLLQETATSQNNMGQISLSDITRSLMPDDKVLFNKIIINCKEIYNSDVAPPQIDSAHALYAKIFLEIDACLGISNPLLSHRKAKHFLELAKAELEEDDERQPKDNVKSKYGLGKNLFEVLFEDDLPSIGILKLMTVTCFLPATNYLRLLFPKMFYQGFNTASKDAGSHSHRSREINPYDLNYKQGIICEIEIKPNASYTVTQKKKAEIFLAHDISTKQPIAALELKWAVSPSKLGWEGVLSLDSWEIFDENHRIKLIDIWLNPEDLSNCSLIPKGHTYRSACKEHR